MRLKFYRFYCRNCYNTYFYRIKKRKCPNCKKRTEKEEWTEIIYIRPGFWEFKEAEE